MTFTIVVTNNSVEDATIDSLVDSDFDLAAHCADAVGTVLGFGETYTCVFTEFISGDYSGPAHENTATVTASDNDGNSDSASDDETVTFTDVLPDIAITKTANPTSVPETGGDVEFTFSLGYPNGSCRVPSDVHRGSRHVQDPLHAQYQGQPLKGNPQGLENDGQGDEPDAGHPRGTDGSKRRRNDDDHQL